MPTKKPEAEPARMTQKQRAEIARKLVQSSQKGLAEARQSLRKDDAQRDKDAAKLLHPTEILNGTHDAGDVWRKLMTTRGGEMRPITVDDLKNFDRLARELGSKYKGGITAKSVINLSLKVDRDRAQKEIHVAIPIAQRDGLIRFATSSGPRSNVERHYVLVDIVDYAKLLVTADTPEKIALAMTKGNIKISCSCGRWRFWFAFLGTKGGYNAHPEHRESAFPRIRNPELHGLACKHILRAVTVFSQAATFKAYLARIVASEQTKSNSKFKRHTIKEQQELAEKLAKESASKHKIKTTEEKRAERESRPSFQSQQQKRQQESAARVAAKSKAANDKSKATVINGLRAMLASGGISQDQYNTMLKTLG
jgi:hypothetical protein